MAIGLAATTAIVTIAVSWPSGWVAVAVLTMLCTVTLLFIFVSVGGLIALHRDEDIQSGRPDLFSFANASRSESMLRVRRTGGFWLPQIWRKFMPPGRLVVGDFVRVKSLDEILSTLDASRCLDGLPFMPEMEKYCGSTATVYRSVDKIYDYGGAKNLRRMTNSVLLTGFRCDGTSHDGCQAECYLIWKAEWLALVLPSSPRKSPCSPMPNSTSTGTEEPRPAAVDKRYTCQFTQLVAATEPMSPRDPRQDLRPVLEGNVSVGAFAVALLTRLFNRAQRLRKGAGFPWMPQKSQRPGGQRTCNFPAGHGVVVCDRESIAATLNTNGRNRGLWFDLEMLKHCGQERKISKTIERIIDDASKKMVFMKTPCVVLEDVQASGEFLRFCPQEELIYWREVWLKPQSEPQPRHTDRTSP